MSTVGQSGGRVHLVFAAAGRTFAVPSEAAEVVKVGELVRLPGARPHVRGVMTQDEEVVPVIDLATALGQLSHGPLRRAVLVRTAQGRYGLGCDEVRGLVAVTASAPAKGGEGLEGVLAPGTYAGGALQVIEPDRLLGWLRG
jgi:chemotaxis signal transduction protein